MTASAPPPVGALAGATNDLGVLWYLVARREWTTLAVVSPDSPPAASRLVGALVELAGPRHQVLEVRDAFELRQKVRAVTRLDVTEARAAPARPWRFLVPLDSVLHNPQAEDVITACDSVVLLLEKGRSRIPEALNAVGLVGRERLLGAVLGRP